MFSIQIMKKIKLVGEPYKIMKNTAFVNAIRVITVIQKHENLYYDCCQNKQDTYKTIDKDMYLFIEYLI